MELSAAPLPLGGMRLHFVDLYGHNNTIRLVRSTGTAFRGPDGASSLRPDHRTNERTSRDRDPKADHIRGCTPYGAEKSRAWLRHRIASLQCSPGCLRAGFDSVKGKANPA